MCWVSFPYGVHVRRAEVNVDIIILIALERNSRLVSILGCLYSLNLL